MAFTRFHDDPGRITKRLAESTFAERYFLGKPGPGDQLPFIEDPQYRLQQWGANNMTNSVNLESDLRGLSRKLNRDHVDSNQYTSHAAKTSAMEYSSHSSTLVDESRATNPAWMYRDLEQPRWEQPWINPQANVEMKFNNNIQTRILEKDYYVPKIPMPFQS